MSMPDAGLRHVVAMGGSAGAFRIMLEQARRAKAGDHSCLFLIYHRAGERDFSFRPYVGADGFQPLSAQTGVHVRADTLYHPFRSHDLEVRDGTILVEPAQGHPHPRIDRLFTSLAVTYGARLLCVLLSGYGRDGLEGLRAVRRAGGRSIVQDPADAEAPHLPRLAIEEGLADSVLPTAQLLTTVDGFLRGSQEAAGRSTDSSGVGDGGGLRR